MPIKISDLPAAGALGGTEIVPLVQSGVTKRTTLSAIASFVQSAITLVTRATNLAGGANGSVPYQSAADTTAMLAAGTAGQLLQTNGAGAPSWVTALSNGITAANQSAGDNSGKVANTAYADRAASLRNYIAGLTLSTAGSSATFTVAAGVATDAGNAFSMALSASLSKTTSAWTVGAAGGGLDTGAIANSTWYHVYLIRRPDTGVVDVCVSTSASAPTTGGAIPAAYSQYRRIGSLRTNGSAQWTLFQQVGDFFLWDTPVLDVSANNPGTSAVTRTLTVPTGVVVESMFNGGVNNLAALVDGPVLFSPLSVADQVPSRTANALLSTPSTANGSGGAIAAHTHHRILTNTSAQIRSRMFQSDANCTLYIATLGWRDFQGRNA